MCIRDRYKVYHKHNRRNLYVFKKLPRIGSIHSGRLHHILGKRLECGHKQNDVVSAESPQGYKRQYIVNDFFIGKPTADERFQMKSCENSVEGAVDGRKKVGKSIGDSHTVNNIGHKYHGFIKLGGSQLSSQQNCEGQFHRDHKEMNAEVYGIVF